MQSFKSQRNATLPIEFNRLLIAWTSSLVADGMRFAAIPLLALATAPSAAAVSAVAAAMSLPWLLVALPAGVLVDRLDPAKVIATANLGRALTVGVVVAAILTGQVGIPLLCIAGFLLTAAETFADSAAQSLLVRIVPSRQLERANARFVGTENLGLDLIGPLAAGGLFAVSQWLPFAVAGVIFLAAAGVMLSLTGFREESAPMPVQRPESGGDQDSAEVQVVADHTPAPARTSVREGFRVIFSDPDLRSLVITVAVLAGSIAAAEGVLVIYSASSLHLPEALYPTLLACYSVGLLTSAAVVSRWGRGVRPGPLMIGAVAAIGLALVVLGVFPQAVVAWCCFVVMGAGGGAWNILSATRRQRRTPRNMVARVSSTFRAIGWGALPLGTALGGWIGQAWSVPLVFVIAGGVVLAMGIIMVPFFFRPQSALPDVERTIGTSGGQSVGDVHGDHASPGPSAG